MKVYWTLRKWTENFRARLGGVERATARAYPVLHLDGITQSGAYMPLTEDIRIRVGQDFPADDVAPVLEMLAELQREDAQLFCDRILRCLVFVARGRFAALADAVALARTDYRDLVVSAESDLDWQQVRDFNRPFGHEA